MRDIQRKEGKEENERKQAQKRRTKTYRPFEKQATPNESMDRSSSTRAYTSFVLLHPIHLALHLPLLPLFLLCLLLLLPLLLYFQPCKPTLALRRPQSLLSLPLSLPPSPLPPTLPSPYLLERAYVQALSVSLPVPHVMPLGICPTLQ